MPIKATFTLSVKSQNYQEVLAALKGQEFEVRTEAPESESIKVPTTKTLVCSRIAQTAIEALSLQAHLWSYRGMDDVIPMYDDIEIEKKALPWYKKPIIPIIVSSGLTALTVYGAIITPPAADDYGGILRAVAIPTAVTFLTQVLFRLFGSHEHLV